MAVDKRNGGGLRVLVTGASGFVGRHLIRRLNERGRYDVFAVGRHSGVDGAVRGLAADLRNEDDVRRVVQDARPDVVFHLAAQSSSVAATASPRDAWEVNAFATMLLADAVRVCAPEATVIFASSIEVYGAAFNDGKVDESVVPRPASVYGRSKLAAEQILNDVLPHTTQCIITRPANHSGIGQDSSFVLPSFAAQVASRKSEIRVGNIDIYRDFLHVEDVVDAYIHLMDCRRDLEDRECFNIASGHPVSLRWIVQRLCQLESLQASIIVDQAKKRTVDVPRTDIDVRRIEASTSWKPNRTIDDLLLDLLSSKRIHGG